MEWKIEPRPGIRTYISDAGFICFQNTDGPEGMWPEATMIHPGDLPEFMDQLREVQEHVETDESNPLIERNVH